MDIYTFLLGLPGHAARRTMLHPSLRAYVKRAPEDDAGLLRDWDRCKNVMNRTSLSWGITSENSIECTWFSLSSFFFSPLNLQSIR
jgi:hypothetical protein